MRDCQLPYNSSGDDLKEEIKKAANNSLLE